jgi:hypothetical protein
LLLSQQHPWRTGRNGRTVAFSLCETQLGVYDERLGYAVKPGPVEVRVGSSSANLPLGGIVEIIGPARAAGADKVFFSRVQVSP